MKARLTVTAAVAAMAALLPGIGSAQSFVLDTGSTPTGSPVILDSNDWYAAQFVLPSGETITELSAYLTQGVGAVGNTYTWDLYSASGTFLGANRESFTETATGTFEAAGWNTTSVNWSGVTPGNYWIALQVSGSTQTPGLDMPTETGADTGTVPAVQPNGWAYAGTSHEFSTSAPSYVGIEVSAEPSVVPLPAALWLFGSGLLGLGALGRRRQARDA